MFANLTFSVYSRLQSALEPQSSLLVWSIRFTVTTAKDKEAAAELTATRRAATEKAGNIMGRYGEILERITAMENMEDCEEEWEEEWEVAW